MLTICALFFPGAVFSGCKGLDLELRLTGARGDSANFSRQRILTMNPDPDTNLELLKAAFENMKDRARDNSRIDAEPLPETPKITGKLAAREGSDGFKN